MAILTVVTGLPGHGKTLNTIKHIEESFPDRPVYYAHIDGLSIERWNEIDDVKRWFDIEPGAVIVIDEAHHYFPRRGNTREREPEHVAKLTEHRHYGHDLFLITQDAKNIDHFVRRLAGQHVHYWRPFGASRVTRWQWSKVVDPNDKMAQKEAISKKLLKLDDKYFGAYHSAEVHTVKRKIPKKMLLLPAAALLVASAAYAGYSTLSSMSAPVPPSFSTPAPAPTLEPAYSVPSPVLSEPLDDAPEPWITGIVQYGSRGIVLVDVGGHVERYSLAELTCSYKYRWTCIYEGQKLRF